MKCNVGDRIYLDLCDEKWRVIEVTAGVFINLCQFFKLKLFLRGNDT